MSSELKIFHSLNCSLCEYPYSKSSNVSKYPCQLECGKLICEECWDKEKSLDNEERKHQCDLNEDCCLTYIFRSFFFDLLNDPSIIESSNGNGWLLSEVKKQFFIDQIQQNLQPITNPLKCPKCDVKYSMEKDESKPVILFCGHAICKKCYLTHRTADPSCSEYFWMKCSICDVSYIDPKSIETRDDWLRVFLRELPELIEQIPKIQEIRIKSIVDPYRERFAKMDQELEENFRAFEESLNQANGTV